MSDDRLRLIDTNILVYAYDISEAEKNSLAKSILQEVWGQSGGVVTLQNLAEFFVVVTRKVEHPLSIGEARTIISDILNSTKRLNEQVKRNRERFPEDFMFQLITEERSEVVANCDHLPRLKFSPVLPYAFTEHGAIMAASVLSMHGQSKPASLWFGRFVRLQKVVS